MRGGGERTATLARVQQRMSALLLLSAAQWRHAHQQAMQSSDCVASGDAVRNALSRLQCGNSLLVRCYRSHVSAHVLIIGSKLRACCAGSFQCQSPAWMTARSLQLPLAGGTALSLTVRGSCWRLAGISTASLATASSTMCSRPNLLQPYLTSRCAGSMLIYMHNNATHMVQSPLQIVLACLHMLCKVRADVLMHTWNMFGRALHMHMIIVRWIMHVPAILQTLPKCCQHADRGACEAAAVSKSVAKCTQCHVHTQACQQYRGISKM